MKKAILSIVLVFSVLLGFATHQRSGEITFRYKGGLTYEITVLTYTYSPSPADRPKLEVNYGDGTKGDIIRTEKIDLPNEIRRNVYIGDHTYNGSGEYIISVEDPNRNTGILNIPNSVNTPFYIQTLLVISPFFSSNSSPVLLLPPIDNGCTNYPYIHNPGAYDPDGDSLSYKLVSCRGAGGQVILGYSLPNMVGSNIGSTITLNPVTGDFVWDSPKQQGEYNVAILIEEYRKGIRIGYVTRDMQINIIDCNNQPPAIEPIPDTCVVAGGVVDFDVVATDPNGNSVTLTGTGGPVVIADHPATFPQPVTGMGTVTSHFHWNTQCSHIRQSAYPMYFKATDNGYPVNMIDIKTMNIRVIGPAVSGLTATPYANTIKLNWNTSPCTNAVGYKIYRHNGYVGYVPGYCETGVPASTGYQLIATNNSLIDTNYVDDNQGAGLAHGIDYCYIVIAWYADGAESQACPEVCTSLKRDLPIITNVTVNVTDLSAGEVELNWVKPTQLDPVQTPGPFKYFIYRSVPAGTGYSLIDSLNSLNDTFYYDHLLNTKQQQIAYQVGLLNNTPGNRFFVGASERASSIFLTIQPTDQKLILNFNYSVPWINDTFVVYRQNPVTLLFDSLGYSVTNQYVDSGLTNGTGYCYYVKGIGRYSADSLPYPLINLSQINCATPVDNVPPCPPVLGIKVDCDLVQNQLTWTNPNLTCCDDVVIYKIYYSPVTGTDFSVIATIGDATNTSFLHSGTGTVAGCYMVTAVDSSGNESHYSNVVCIDIDSCPVYQLPNVFTPNHDNENDLFRPFPYSSVERIDLTVFNRWGTIVFTTSDPDILWDGIDKKSKQPCSDGVYFYTCDVYEKRLKGLTKRTLNGVIHLLR